jgi:SAM-dependent methyltransferase
MPDSEQASTRDQTEEQRRWNDPAWTASWPRREALTSQVTPVLVDHLGPLEEARVLEIGSGGGTATFALAERVGGGSVTGADISVPLCELARRRAEDRGVGNATFVVADAQRDTVPGAPFTAATSQFGVMFFDDPVQAFANIRAHVAPGAPLAFACWREPAANPWIVNSTIASFAPPPPNGPSGPPATGPFSLADTAATTALVEAAGWDEVRASPFDLVVTVDQEVLFDEASLRFFRIPEDRLDAAGEAVLAQLRPLARPDGRYDAPLAFQVFTARAPR